MSIGPSESRNLSAMCRGCFRIAAARSVGHVSHVRQEVIDANVLKKTGNTLRIQVTAGSASFSDMVLMHQSTV